FLVERDRRLGIFKRHLGAVDAVDRLERVSHLGGAMVALQTCEFDHSDLHLLNLYRERCDGNARRAKMHIRYAFNCAQARPATSLRWINVDEGLALAGDAFNARNSANPIQDWPPSCAGGGAGAQPATCR